MADIAGIGVGGSAFGFNPTRSTPSEPEEQLQRPRPEETTPRPADRGAEVAPSETDAPDQASQTDADSQAAGDRAPELTEDTVSLSAGAEEALAAEAAAGAAAEAAPTPAAGATNAVAADTRETNQVARQEDTTAEVNGNQNNQSEGTRTLGQVVDQFA
ncbi:MAG: hypothetical protein RIB45_09970 [Marivibrio sp.]|uniref:hypothetical protein n=1 Tax=Marivibrio sp. TaxID=2039719 RepID=UPI0032EBD504